MTPSALLRRLVLVKPGEMGALLWSSAYFFFLLSSYYILRPVRETMGIERGADKLAWLMTGTMAAMFLANPLFAWLVSCLPRRRFIPVTYHVCALLMVAFWAVMSLTGESQKAAVGYAFYIWVSVFNLFAVSVFWSFLADLFTTEQGKRLFGFIGVGGTLGAICGAAATAGLARLVGPFGLLLVSAALLEAAVVCVGGLARTFALDGSEAGSRSEGDGRPVRRKAAGEPGPGVLTGVALVLRSPYLLLICLYLFLYTVLNTFLYIQQGTIVDAAVTDRAARTAVFAQMDLWTNVLTITMQLFVAGRLIRGLGVGAMLGLLPLISAAGFAVLWLVSGQAEHAATDAARAAALQTALLTVAVFQVVRRGVHYAVSQPSRQILFTHLGPDEIYKSKPFIDTFVYRGGDLAGAWAPTAIMRSATALGLGAASAVAASALPLAAVSLGVGLTLGRMQARARRAQEQGAAGTATQWTAAPRS